MKIEKLDLNGESLSRDSTDFKKMEAESFVSVEEKIMQQPLALSIGQHYYKGEPYPTPLGSYGDYSCIVGSSKSKKTWLKSALMACYIGGRSNLYFDNIRGHNTTGKYILDFDTEQSRFHSQRVFKRVTEMVGANTPYYRSFALRKYSANQRLEFIEYMLTKSRYAGNIGLVAIDGLADLLDDFNDLAASTKLMNNLLTWTAEQNCHIITVLHKNFGSEKPVGHLGSAILKKAETILFTDIDETDPSTTLVTCKYSRNISFDDFKFRIGDNWLPYSPDVFSY